MAIEHGKLLRKGFTTGTAAAAAAKAAVLVLLGKRPESVTVLTGDGVLSIPVHSMKEENGTALCSVIKDAGDDPDVTDGIEVCSSVTLTEDDLVVIDGGKGVGRVTKKGLPVPVGKAAINPGPLRMIEEAVRDVLPWGAGAEIIVSVPEGEQAAKKTFNPRLGILGGISILGTTGIVNPMSDEAYAESLAVEIDMLLAEGIDSCAFVFGESSKPLAEAVGFQDREIIVTSNFLGFMLQYAALKGMKKVTIVGKLGKLCKVAGGIFQTHSKYADGRSEILACFAGLLGASTKVIRELYDASTTDEAVEIIEREQLTELYSLLVNKVVEKSVSYVHQELQIEAVLYTNGGELLSQSGGAGK